MKRAIPTFAFASFVLFGSAPSSVFAEGVATIVSVDRVGHTVTVREPGETRTRTLSLDATTDISRQDGSPALTLDALEPGDQIVFDTVIGSGRVGTRAERIQIVTPVRSGPGAMPPGEGSALRPGDNRALPPGDVGAPSPGAAPTVNDTQSEIDREIDGDRQTDGSGLETIPISPGGRPTLNAPPGGHTTGTEGAGNGMGLGTGGSRGTGAGAGGGASGAGSGSK